MNGFESLINLFQVLVNNLVILQEFVTTLFHLHIGQSTLNLNLNLINILNTPLGSKTNSGDVRFAPLLCLVLLLDGLVDDVSGYVRFKCVREEILINCSGS